MDCRITSTRKCAAFTLIEMCIAMGIGSLVLLVIAALSLYSGRSFAAMANYIDMDAASRNALDRMTRDIRQVSHLVSYSTNQLTFQDTDGKPLQFTYIPNARTLRRLKDDVSEVLLTECDSLAFSVYQRNPMSGSYDHYPASINPFTNNCKLVQIDWNCSRTLFGSKAHTELAQSAKVVIRKQ